MQPTASNEPWLSSALAGVGFLVEQAGLAGIPAGRMMLLGFSQGACQAVQALRSQRDRGLQMIVFAASSAWWLQHYPELHDELRGRHRRLHAGGGLEAYRLL